MTEEQEYAKELFDKMAFQICDTDAKICALICIDEMIRSHIEWATEQDECVYFYKDVKKELEKL